MTGDIREELGLVQIYTGNGKGKTTAALGLSLRAMGRGLNVLFFQFMKPDAGYGEQLACSGLDGITVISRGADHFVSDPPSEGDVRLAKDALSECAGLMGSGKYDLVVMDEAMNAVRLGLVSSAELISVLESRPKHIEVVLTGRGMTPELEQYADLITEMRLVKHPMDVGIDARKGIEYRSHQSMAIRGCSPARKRLTTSSSTTLAMSSTASLPLS
ncbi:MAG: cob(I)yrinic acid a,c-diamide adenosyltransferase [Candidatus Methanomethylophilaceae archaeon]|nr:cob(I)yrinic acid a,c-diamide adenosyltransferase [Candidatus Methanomethylophilaceae archaeon]